MTATPPIKSVSLVSLGCPKNLVDSEKMLGLLAEAGLVAASADVDADAIVINTCGFLEASKAESIEHIRHAAGLKRAGRIRRLVVAGCLVQRHRAKLLKWCPEIDAMIGVFDRDRIVDAVRGPEAGGRRGSDVAVELPVYSSIAANATIAKRHRGLVADGYYEDDRARLRLTPRHYAYLRISEGCNQNCAFCTIPSIRGKMRSKPQDRVVAEARELLSDGAFELNLIGQDTTSYGKDIGYDRGLVGLLETLDRVAEEFGGAWIRLMYAYPSCFTDPMIDAIGGLANVVKYIDMPLQHINDRVLERMRRRTSRNQIETLLGKLRDRGGGNGRASGRGGGMVIRTTFISGFPGETDAEHRELVDFVRGFGFDAMGVFAYSPEPATPAAAMHGRGDAVPDGVVAERIDELMRTQQKLVFARNARLADARPLVQVLIDGPALRDNPDECDDRGEPAAYAAATQRVTRLGNGGGYQGRLRSQAPQIDGSTFVQSNEPLAGGELVDCRITDYDGYDLGARPVAESSSPGSSSAFRLVVCNSSGPRRTATEDTAQDVEGGKDPRPG